MIVALKNLAFMNVLAFHASGHSPTRSRGSVLGKKLRQASKTAPPGAVLQLQAQGVSGRKTIEVQVPAGAVPGSQLQASSK